MTKPQRTFAMVLLIAAETGAKKGRRTVRGAIE